MKLLKYKLLAYLGVFFLGTSIAQVDPQVEKDIKKLCSKSFKGRGYTFDGDKKADAYITKELKKVGLTVSHHGFTFSANTFSGAMQLSINDKEIVAGEEFIVAPNSPSIKGTFPLKEYPVDIEIETLVEQIKTGKRSQILLFDDALIKQQSKDKQNKFRALFNELQTNGRSVCKGIIIKNCKKLTFSASQTQSKLALIRTLRDDLETGERATFEIEAEFKREYRSQNVFTHIKGENTDSFYVFTAHYDHLGTMGKDVFFPGANDNASGTTFLLELARHYALNKPKYSIYFIFFSGEEIGLLGSTAFVRDEVLNLNRLKFLLNFDLLGTGEEGIQIVNSSLYKKEYDVLKSINDSNKYLTKLKKRGSACNSDHCPFHNEGAKSFFIYTLGGIQAYHDIYDVPETLPLTEFNDVQSLIKTFIATNK